MAFRDLILNNFRRKLFAFLLAVLIWLTIHFADKKERAETAGSGWQTNSIIYP